MKSKSKAKELLISAMMSVVLIMASLHPACAQEPKVYAGLAEYSKWSFVAGPVLYNKAEVTPQYGNHILENRNMPGFNAGVMYDFNPDRKWSFQTGLLVAKEPIYSVRVRIDHNDIYPEWPGNLNDKFKAYAIYTFSFPLLLRLNVQTGDHSYASFLTGLKAMYFPNGQQELTWAISSDELADYREIYGLKLESPENTMQGSFLIGTGYSLARKKVLLKASLIYVMNFQNTITGEYQFANLFTSPDTRGYYNLSGNYLGLLFAVSFKKKSDER
ncbi:MAG: hypothetical protein WC271_15830 [Bacteroidales bacterium]